jgi:asparagine synthase (glutamine-hydrolysing)
VSDVPVGVLLSGGLDSSAVLEAAHDTQGTKLPCFTVGFDAPGVPDERPYARLAAEHLGGEPFEITIRPEEFRDFLPKYVHWMEEPVCEPPAIALYRVAELAARHVKVVLSGEGGDECFAGYSNYQHEQSIERFARMLGPLGRVAAGLGMPPGRSMRMARIREALRYPLEDRYLSRTSGPDRMFNGLQRASFEPAFLEEGNYEWSVDYVRRLWDRTTGWTPLQSMLYVDTRTWLPDDLLVKADKMTMANSLELRVPLLDHKLLEFAASLPDDMKLRNGINKAVFRKMVSRRLPRELIERKKAGFPIPYAEWFRESLADFLRDILLDEHARIRAIVQKHAVESLINEHSIGRDRSKELFCLLVLELWIREFIG